MSAAPAIQMRNLPEAVTKPIKLAKKGGTKLIARHPRLGPNPGVWGLAVNLNDAPTFPQVRIEYADGSTWTGSTHRNHIRTRTAANLALLNEDTAADPTEVEVDAAE